MRRTVVGLALSAALGCASGDPPAPAPAPAPLSVVPAPPAPSEPEPAEEPEAPPPAGDEAGAARDDLTVLEIPAAETAPGAPRDLVAAAAAERRRREQAAPSTVVIDQESLADYADVEITFASAPGEESEDAAAADATAAALAAAEQDEAYWRSRVLEPRRRWREAHDSIERLEEEIALLRRRFYMEDDPFYRDSQIKPAWDRALVEVREARREVEEARADLEAALEEGRRAGAAPGWLREGIDLQPERSELPRGDSLQTEESGIYEPEEPDVRQRRDRRDGGDGGAR